MRLLLAALLFCGACFAQETNLTTPATIGPVQVKPDTESISSFDWSTAGMPVASAFVMDVPRTPIYGGGSEKFFVRPYPHGLSLEYAGLVEWTTEKFSLRTNFRYFSLLPKTYGNGVQFFVGDRLDTGGLYIQPVGTLRVDSNNEYVIEPETGQPYLDNKAIEFTARTFRGQEEGGLDAGDIHFIARGATRKFQFKGGPKTSEAIYAEIGPDGLIVGGVNYTTLIASLKSRLDALEQGGPVSPPPTE